MDPELVERIKASFAGVSPGDIEVQLTASRHAQGIRDVSTLARYVAAVASGDVDPLAAPGAY